MMNWTMLEQFALAEPTAGIAQELQAPLTQRFFLKGEQRQVFDHRSSQHKSVAEWLLDEHSKLHFQWVKA